MRPAAVSIESEVLEKISTSFLSRGRWRNSAAFCVDVPDFPRIQSISIGSNLCSLWPKCSSRPYDSRIIDAY